jgi:ComF family protein
MDCRLRSPGWQAESSLPVFAWGDYKGALKRSIAALKYHHHSQLAVPLGTWMASAWNLHPERGQSAIVVPIPMHATKQKERGFNQAELLAKSFCAMTGLPLQAHGLVRQRETEAQFRLGGVARSQNVKGAFALGQAFAQNAPKRPVLLLDDIFTTGATAQAAAHALCTHGIQVQGMVVLAIAKFPRE